MSRSKYPPEYYAELKARTGLSNREIGRRLGVNESTVRRNLGAGVIGDIETQRARQRAALLTDKGRARTRKFRLREYLKRLKEKP
jgi:transposase